MEKRYQELIQNIDLEDIYIDTATFRRLAFPDFETYPEVTADLSGEDAKYSVDGDQLCVDQTLKFELSEANKETGKSRHIFEASVTFTLVYSSKVAMDDELFKLFKKRNIPLNLHPYFREFVHNSMARAGVPAFILPVIKVKR